jgi:hypothetical protein
MKSLLAYFDSVGKIVAGLTGLVALVSGAISLYFVLRPPPPVKGKAEFAKRELRQFGPPTPLGLYFNLAGERSLAHSYTTQALNTVGVFYTVPVSLVGLRNTDTKVAWSLYRATDRAPVADWINQPAGTVKAPRNDFTFVLKVWIQLPELAGNYFAVIEIDLGNKSLDLVETPTFTGRSAVPGPPPTTTAATTTATGPVITGTLPTTTAVSTTTIPTTTAATTTEPGTTTTSATTSTTGTQPTTTVAPPPSHILVRPPAIITSTRTSRP